MKKIFMDIISILILYVIIGLLWQGVEKLMYGEITPKLLDDIVALILAVSLFYNLK